MAVRRWCAPRIAATSPRCWQGDRSAHGFLARTARLRKFAAHPVSRAPSIFFLLNESLPPRLDRHLSEHRPRLVVAEDEPSLCQFLGELLETEYTVEIALNGEQAWEAIQQKPPNLVLANANMPVLDGLGLVQRMRGAAVTATVPVLVLSAQAGRAASEEALAAGADGWMQKPFRPGELLAALRALRGG